MKKSVILGIETSTEACSVALLCGDKLYSAFEIIPQQHTQRLFPMIKQVLAQADTPFSALDAIAVGRGPGSFTGLRIAMSVAQGLAFGLGLPIYPISTLSALAEQAKPFAVENNKKTIITTLDARMGELYMAHYDLCDHVLSAEQLIAYSAFERWRDKLDALHVGIGNGVDRHCYPRAEEIVQLAKKQREEGKQGVAPENAEPCYLREKVAEKRKPNNLY